MIFRPEVLCFEVLVGNQHPKAECPAAQRSVDHPTPYLLCANMRKLDGWANHAKVRRPNAAPINPRAFRPWAPLFPHPQAASPSRSHGAGRKQFGLVYEIRGWNSVGHGGAVASNP